MSAGARFFDPGSRCRTCGYGGELGCGYLLLTGRRRPCPPGEACTEYVPRVGRRRPEMDLAGWPTEDPTTSARRGYLHGGRPALDLSRSETACRMYAEGAYDTEIARAVGCCAQSVARWRRETGRKANPRRKKE